MDPLTMDSRTGREIRAFALWPGNELTQIERIRAPQYFRKFRVEVGGFQAWGAL